VIYNDEQAATIMKEFIPSSEWECLSERLKTRHGDSLVGLKTANTWEQVLRMQERVRVLEEVLGLPQRMIQEAKHGK